MASSWAEFVSGYFLLDAISVTPKAVTSDNTAGRAADERGAGVADSASKYLDELDEHAARIPQAGRRRACARAEGGRERERDVACTEPRRSGVRTRQWRERHCEVQVSEVN